MISLEVKGTYEETQATLLKRGITPLSILEKKSTYVSGLVTCNVATFSRYRELVSQWWLEGEGWQAGERFPVGSLMYFSSENAPQESAPVPDKAP